MKIINTLILIFFKLQIFNITLRLTSLFSNAINFDSQIIFYITYHFNHISLLLKLGQIILIIYEAQILA